MNTYAVSYKAGLNYATLPAEVDADGFMTEGRFIDFWRQGAVSYERETVHRIAAEAIIHIEMQTDPVDGD